MALYAFYGIDKSDTGPKTRAENRPAHIEWLQSLGETLRLAGPLLSDDGKAMIGSLVIFDCADRAELDALIAEDPYAKAGLFERVEIRPYKWALGAGAPDR
ncbi:MAG: YciI family protein [Henriciella sp.]|nr:YciI family protein [Henriciella sp.]